MQTDEQSALDQASVWKNLARYLGCGLHGFNDERSAGFITPDGEVIEIGPKFREQIEALQRERDELDLRLTRALNAHAICFRAKKIAEAERDRMREALEPFARAAKWWKAFHDFHRITSLHQHGDCLEVIHLRNAAAAIRAINGENDG